MTETQKNAPNVEAENTKNEPFQLIPPFKIDKKTKALAKTAGFDIGPIEAGLNRVNEWAQNVEARFKIAEQNFNAIDKGLTSLAPLIQYAEKMKNPQPAQEENAQPQAPQGLGGGLAQILPYIMQAMGSGGGDNSFNEMAKSALMSQINMSKAITNAVVSKITAKATSDVANQIAGE